MSDYDFIKMQKKLAKYLDENRYEHTLGVMFTCASLAMVHGYDLAYIAKAKYNVIDKEILSAITYHTTGKPDMTMLEKIVYIADYIEPARNKAPRLTEIRRLAFEDLDECMYQILKDTLSYLDENPNDVDSATKDAYAYYTMLHEDRLKIRKQA